MEVILEKGPNFEETEKRLYQYLYKVLKQKTREIEKWQC